VKKSRFSESQILAILRESGSGIPVAEVCRKHGISAPTYYQWKSKYAGMSLPEPKRVKELEAENAKLKRMYAERALGNNAIKDILPRKLRPAGLQAFRGRRSISRANGRYRARCAGGGCVE
jgi:putative transposase